MITPRPSNHTLKRRGTQVIGCSSVCSVGNVAQFTHLQFNADHEVCIVPGASHSLKPVKTIFDPGIAGDMTPEASAKLRPWLAKTLRSPTKK